MFNFSTMTTADDKPAKDKPTSAPLPAAHRKKQRGDALRGNLSKRKQQDRAREMQHNTDTNNTDTPGEE
ncbi:MAG: hypothetical protein PW788_01245 [Micavibrio sp.]|nr:hypothetical protein [Micavibrio sp.]